MIYTGIDPGLSGYVAKLLPGGAFAFYECPTVMWRGKKRFDPAGMARVMRADEKQFVVIEKQWSRPGEGAVNACTICQGFGLWVGIIVALKLPHAVVPPTRWQKTMHARAEGKTVKEKSISVVGKLFPGVSLLRTPRCRKPCHDKADALLMADYARRLCLTKGQ